MDDELKELFQELDEMELADIAANFLTHEQLMDFLMQTLTDDHKHDVINNFSLVHKDTVNKKNSTIHFFDHKNYNPKLIEDLAKKVIGENDGIQ